MTEQAPYRAPSTVAEVEILQAKLREAERTIQGLQAYGSWKADLRAVNKWKLWDNLGKAICLLAIASMPIVALRYLGLPAVERLARTEAVATVRASEEFHSPRVGAKCYSNHGSYICELRGPGPRSITLRCNVARCWRDW